VKKPGGWSIPWIVAAAAFLNAGGCSDKGDNPPEAPPAGVTLTAVPPAVSVGQGQAANVVISGGTPPYAIRLSPDTSLVSAALLNPTSNPVTLVITGVTVATGSTSIRVGDSSPVEKGATVQITKIP
jgi:hypothetical protein